MKNKLYYFLAVFLAGTILTGCSSSSDNDNKGSDGGNSTNSKAVNKKPAEITKANAEDIIEIAFSSLDIIDFAGMANINVNDLGAASTKKLLADEELLKAWTFKQLIKYSGNSIIPAASYSDANNCPDGGNASYTVTEKSLGEHETHELISANFKNCNMFGLVVDGSTEMELTTTHISSITKKYTFYQNINNLKISMIGSYDDLSVVMNGSINGVCEDLNINESCTLTSDSLEIVTDNQWVHIFEAEFKSKEGVIQQTLNVDYKINSSELVGMLHTTTLSSLTYLDEYELPIKGKIQVKGANNNYVEIGFRLEDFDFWSEPVADINVFYAGGHCSAIGITEEQLDDDDWACN